MTPTSGTSSPTPSQELIQPAVNVNAEEGLQESSGPEARETPQRSSLLVLHYRDSSTLDRKRRATYQRLMTLLNRWEYQRRSIIRMDLTTANGGDPSKLSDHYEELIRRIKRKTGVEDIQYWKMTTREGNGVIHAILAGNVSLYVDQKWLSEEWEKIHGAIIVYVKRYRGGSLSRGRVSRYLVSQYMAGQDAQAHVSWTWKTTFNVPIVRFWKQFKAASRGLHIKKIVKYWDRLIRDEVVEFGPWACSLARGWYVLPEWEWATEAPPWA